MVSAPQVSQGHERGRQQISSLASPVVAVFIACSENKNVSSSLRFFFYKSVLFKGNFSFLFSMS